jgi:hypothetical protein
LLYKIKQLKQIYIGEITIWDSSLIGANNILGKQLQKRFIEIDKSKIMDQN